MKLVHKSRGLARLLHFLLAPNAPGVQSAAVDCLTKVAQSGEHHNLFFRSKGKTTDASNSLCFSLALTAESLRLLHEEGTEKVLAELLSVDDIGVKKSACQAVAAMSFHPASRDIFRDLGT